MSTELVGLGTMRVAVWGTSVGADCRGSPAMPEVLMSASVEVAFGLEFPEGPIAMPDGTVVAV